MSLLPISSIVRALGLDEAYVEPYGNYGAKLRLELLEDPRYAPSGKLILVTATTPRTSGEGKTVTSIGLAEALSRRGKRAIVTSREPSLGPVFGLKGGAAGGGLSQVEPAERINLHFHGDFHAITSAHNLLAALIDAHLFYGNALEIDPEQITWPRAIDMNDRALRHIQVGLGEKDGVSRKTGFLITAASEIMAILGLCRSRQDLRERLARIVVAFTQSGRPILAADLGATGAMMALLNEAILPNLVQTTEGTPALVHTGPFGNIAHGTSSVLSQQMGIRLADYVINETGFASDLGAEKYVDLVMPVSGIRPSAAVLVTSVQSLSHQGEGDLDRGAANLYHHIQNLVHFGLPVVVAINHFPQDTLEDLARVQQFCNAAQVRSAIVEAYQRGGEGALDLADHLMEVLATIDAPQIHPVYSPTDSLPHKIAAIARNVYGASGVEFSERAQEHLHQFAALGFSGMPVCIAKTQFSLTDDPKATGAPTNWKLHIVDAYLSAGAGFVVLPAGSMLLMPGLPKHSRVSLIDVDRSGNITGLS